MKTVTFDEARTEFERIFELAAAGETIIVQRNNQCIALRRFGDNGDADIAPPSYFANDYSPQEIAELNALAAQAPQASLP